MPTLGHGWRTITGLVLLTTLAGCGDSVAERAASGALMGAAVGGIAGGPIGIAVGGVAGGGTGALLPRGIDRTLGLAGR